jgi:phosphoglycolate phosphatase-like HAD superfamily hydrolase
MIETINPGASAPDPRIAIFDFDGTVSLIRSGWLDIMTSMMIETLAALNTGETEEELRKVIRAFVWANTGKDILCQTISLADAVAERGGVPPDPQEYKQRFLARLFEVSGKRIENLRTGSARPDEYLVPGTRAILEDLRARGLSLYLASGTDQADLDREAELLDIARYFDGGVYGALPDPDAFSKRILVERLLNLPGMRPDRLLGFGDGPTEIQELKRGRSLAVGLATDEPECRVTDEWKRHNLIAAGADYIIPNYLCRQALLPALFADHEPI